MTLLLIAGSAWLFFSFSFALGLFFDREHVVATDTAAQPAAIRWSRDVGHAARHHHELGLSGPY